MVLLPALLICHIPEKQQPRVISAVETQFSEPFTRFVAMTEEEQKKTKLFLKRENFSAGHHSDYSLVLGEGHNGTLMVKFLQLSDKSETQSIPSNNLLYQFFGT